MRHFLLLALVLVLVAGCPASNTAPATVRALDLAQYYRDTPSTADDAFNGRLVLLALTNPVAVGNELRWHLASPDKPAVVVCQFDGPLPAVGRVVWLTGTCRGKVRDGKEREFPGYDFHVLVTGCNVARPPTTPAP